MKLIFDPVCTKLLQLKFQSIVRVQFFSLPMQSTPRFQVRQSVQIPENGLAYLTSFTFKLGLEIKFANNLYAPGTPAGSSR